MYKKEKKKKNTTGNKLVRNVSAVFLVASIHTQTHVHRHTHSDVTDWLPSFKTEQRGSAFQYSNS